MAKSKIRTAIELIMQSARDARADASLERSYKVGRLSGLRGSIYYLLGADSSEFLEIQAMIDSYLAEARDAAA